MLYKSKLFRIMNNFGKKDNKEAFGIYAYNCSFNMMVNFVESLYIYLNFKDSEDW